MARPWLGAASPPPLGAAAIFAAIMAAAIVAIDHRNHPFERIGPANYVTTFRALLVAVAAATLFSPPAPVLAWIVVVLAAVVAMLDGIDGRLARRTHMVSAFGARFDMEVDALFILVLSLLVWRHGKAGAWILGAGLMRYAFVAATWVLSWMARPLRSTTRGKAIAVAQVAGLALALTPTTPVPASRPIAALTLAALAWSFAIDVHHLWRTQTPAKAAG